jgi:hypothetical protein
VFCHNCGKELDAGSGFCPYCGASQTMRAVPREQVVVLQQSPSTDQVVGAILILIILGGLLYFGAAVQAFDCPVCQNSVWIRWACTLCGGDGKVTLFELLAYSLSRQG